MRSELPTVFGGLLKSTPSSRGRFNRCYQVVNAGLECEICGAQKIHHRASLDEKGAQPWRIFCPQVRVWDTRQGVHWPLLAFFQIQCSLILLYKHHFWGTRSEGPAPARFLPSSFDCSFYCCACRKKNWGLRSDYN